MSNCYDIPKVIICVRGGVAEIMRREPDICVEIRDYDCDGSDEDRIMEDNAGDKYISTIVEAEE